MMSSSQPSSRPDSGVDPFANAPSIPFQDAWLLEPPRASYLEQAPESANTSSRGSYAFHTADNSSPFLAQGEKRLSNPYAAPELLDIRSPVRKRPIFTRPIFWIILVVAFIIVAAAVVVPVYFFVIKHHSNLSSSPGTSSGTGPAPGKNPTTGGNGSVITTSDGTTFTYINNFGGFCEFSSILRGLVMLGVCDYRIRCSSHKVVIRCENLATVSASAMYRPFIRHSVFF